MNYPRQIARTFRQGISSPAGWAAALLLAVVLGAAPLAESMDTADEWAESQALIDAQIAAQQDHRKQKAAQDLCLSTIGESSAAWTADGELVCTPRKVKK